MALDARVVLHGSEMTAEHLPEAAIRPYPMHLVSDWTMKDGSAVTIRPFAPRTSRPLSSSTPSSRSAASICVISSPQDTQRTAHERLSRICFIDYNREMALVVERKLESGETEILAVGRLSKLHSREDAEMDAVVIDAAQHKGLGTELYRLLIRIARDEKLKMVISNMLIENREMRAMCVRYGFKMFSNSEDKMIRAELELEGSIDYPTENSGRKPLASGVPCRKDKTKGRHFHLRPFPLWSVI